MTLPINRRLVTGVPYTILAPGDPALGLTAMRFNPVVNLGDGGTPTFVNGTQGAVSGLQARSTGQVEVLDNDFSRRAVLLLGPYRLESDVDFAADGLALNVIATNLAAAITLLSSQGYEASALGAVVSILGPLGPAQWVLAAEYDGAIVNFALTPSRGYLVTGGPAPSGPVLIP